MKIATIVGARPQFTKAAVLSRKFLQEEDIHEIIIHTGQHYDQEMSAAFFHELSIPEPSYNLGINNLPNAEMTAAMLQALEPLLRTEMPDMVLVYGDTNSTLAGALAAKKIGLPLAHVEAGLRSGDMKMQEEINRLLTDTMSDLLFCPTATAYSNLRKENISEDMIHLVGDIMYDAALLFAAEDPSIPLFPTPYVITTFHRHQLLESPAKVKRLLDELKQLHNEVPVLLVAHPRTRSVIESMDASLPFRLVSPLPYLQMNKAIRDCEMVITDSGGLQKEAYFFKKLCITLRPSTEWTELVDAGVNFIAGEEGTGLVSIYKKAKTVKPDFSQMFYGDGNASSRIIEKIKAFMSERQQA